MESLSEGVWILSDGPACGAVIRLQDGGLWVKVATPPEDLSELGEVTHLVLSDARHAAHLAGWAERYPEAQRWSVGLRGHAGLPTHTPLGDRAPKQWQGELELRQVRGSGHAEAWIVHPASLTAILPPAPGWHERWAFFGLRRHVGAAVRWLEGVELKHLVEDNNGLVQTDVSAHIRARFAWVGADGPIPPAMRFALGANPGGAGAFAVVLMAVMGLLAGVSMEAPSDGARLVTALVLGDVACGLVGQSLSSTQAWWAARGVAGRATLLGLHIAHPLALALAWGSELAPAVGLWAVAILGAVVPRVAAVVVVLVGAVLFPDVLPGPAWWPAVYLLKLSSVIRRPQPDRSD